MKRFVTTLSVLLVEALFLSVLSANPLPYTGKLSVDRINFHGRAEFSFAIRDGNGTVHWKHAADNSSIQVNVVNGRYQVMLGGQGMEPLPPQLFLDRPRLFLVISADLGDGRGPLPLKPDQRITSSAHALSADLAGRAKVADSVSPGAITDGMLSPKLLEKIEANATIAAGAIQSKMLAESLRQQIDAPVSASRLDPTLKAYFAPLFEPQATSTVSDVHKFRGTTATLSAPSASGKNLSYQWSREGILLSGATGKELVIPELNASHHGGTYTVTVGNDFGSFSQSLELKVFEVAASRLVAGDQHLLFLDSDGFLMGVGRSESGELGMVDQASSVPVKIVEEPVADFATGAKTTLFLKSDGSLWGMGELGILKDIFGNQRDPVRLADGPLHGFAGTNGSLYFIESNGSLWSAGSNFKGKLGDGTTQNRNSPVQVMASGAREVIARNEHVAVIKDDGSLWTFGKNSSGELGTGTQVNSSIPQKIEESGVVAAWTSFHSTVFLKSDGTLWGMGNNGSKNLMNINQYKILQPVQIASGVSNAALGDNHLIYLDHNGTLWGRGSNKNGRLGQTTEKDFRDPVEIISGGVTDLVAGSSFSAVLLEDERILTFGKNEFGQMGTGDLIWTRTPKKIPGLRVKYAAANGNGTYFVDLNHSLWSVGGESFGDLGDGGGSKDLDIPVRVVAGGVDSVQTRAGHVLYRELNGSLMGFGSGGEGQLTGRSNSYLPTSVYPGQVLSFATGGQHSAMVLADGSLWSFGKNNRGQLGDGNTTDRTSPVRIVDANVSQVVAGNEHTLFLKTDGSVWAMGRNSDGQLGDGTKVERLSPVRIMEANASGVACGGNFSFVLKNDGSLWSFGGIGENRSGVKNNGTYVLQQVMPSGVASVAGGDLHSLILKTDGSLWSTGSGKWGKTGHGHYGNSHLPFKIVEVGVVGIATGKHHSVYWTDTGEVYVFGYNGSGQLGLGTTLNVMTPSTLGSFR